MVDIFCTHPHLSRGMLCCASEPHPRRKVLPFLHDSEALGSLTWPAPVNNTHLLGTLLTRAFSSSYTYEYRRAKTRHYLICFSSIQELEQNVIDSRNSIVTELNFTSSHLSFQPLCHFATK